MLALLYVDIYYYYLCNSFRASVWVCDQQTWGLSVVNLKYYWTNPSNVLLRTFMTVCWRTSVILSFGKILKKLCFMPLCFYGWRNYVFRSSRSLEGDISKLPLWIFFKLGTNVRLNSRMTWLEFGGKRSRLSLKSCFSQKWRMWRSC